MLMLRRKVGESIVVGMDVYITVVSNEKDYIQLGFEAPNSTPINRLEIFNALKRKDKKGSL